MAAPAPAPANLTEELAAFLAGDPGVIALFGARAFNGDAPRDADFPYLGWNLAQTSRLNVIGPGGRGTDTLTVHFRVHAADAGGSARLAGQLKGRLLPRPGYAPVPFAGAYGNEFGRYTTGPDSNEQDPERAPFGSDAWTYTFPATWMIARG